MGSGASSSTKIVKKIIEEGPGPGPLPPDSLEILGLKAGRRGSSLTTASKSTLPNSRGSSIHHAVANKGGRWLDSSLDIFRRFRGNDPTNMENTMLPLYFDDSPLSNDNIETIFESWQLFVDDEVPVFLFAMKDAIDAGFSSPSSFRRAAGGASCQPTLVPFKGPDAVSPSSVPITGEKIDEKTGHTATSALSMFQDLFHLRLTQVLKVSSVCWTIIIIFNFLRNLLTTIIIFVLFSPYSRNSCVFMEQVRQERPDLPVD
jgi:hypothetical protein